jgi:hypothetical protein
MLDAPASPLDAWAARELAPVLVRTLQRTRAEAEAAERRAKAEARAAEQREGAAEQRESELESLIERAEGRDGVTCPGCDRLFKTVKGLGQHKRAVRHG